MRLPASTRTERTRWPYAAYHVQGVSSRLPCTYAAPADAKHKYSFEGRQRRRTGTLDLTITRVSSYCRAICAPATSFDPPYRRPSTCRRDGGSNHSTLAYAALIATRAVAPRFWAPSLVEHASTRASWRCVDRPRHASHSPRPTVRPFGVTTPSLPLHGIAIHDRYDGTPCRLVPRTNRRSCEQQCHSPTDATRFARFDEAERRDRPDALRRRLPVSRRR